MPRSTPESRKRGEAAAERITARLTKQEGSRTLDAATKAARPSKDAAAAKARATARRGGLPRGTPESRQRGADAAERITAMLSGARTSNEAAAKAAAQKGSIRSAHDARGQRAAIIAARGEFAEDATARNAAIMAAKDARGQKAALMTARGTFARTPASTGAEAAEHVAAALANTPDADIALKAASEVAAGFASKQLAAAHHQVRIATERLRQVHDDIERSDELHMRRTLALAEQYRGRTSPNPIVGCVIVDPLGHVIAEGVHRGPGTPHAEVDALSKLGGKAHGGTLYVNLEPCTHQGRTPPCAPVVAAAELARVVIGALDPIVAHGGGLQLLEEAGITVSRVLVEECELANVPFRTWALTRHAAFTLKAAITLDGKIATVGGESRWITGEEARLQGHRLRATHDAVLVGIGTVLADDPELTARIPDGRDPVRIVVDSALRTPVTSKLLRVKGSRTIIATTEDAPVAKERALVARGAEVWRFPSHKGQVSLEPLALRLAEESILSVLVEGGGRIHAGLLAAGLATDLQLFVAPLIVGGPAPSWVGGPGLGKLAQAWRLQFVGQPQRFGDDLLLRAVLRPRPRRNR